MIGIVAVSHSRALAEAAVHLALQMGEDRPPVVLVAAGGPDGDLGTDAVAIAAAVDEADGGDGVLVLMDLGSAILSAETALDFVAAPERVRLSPAPFVEGLVAAVVTAAGGAGLDEVAGEAAGVDRAKRGQLGETTDDSEDLGPAISVDTPPHEELAFEAVVINPSGLHARPAATFVKAASHYDADIRIVDLDTGGGEASARSLLELMALGVRQGSRVRVSATGLQAAQALEELRALIDDGFGER
ncbi:dihydroxyacetone kinase phosphoryl donor subunit DhaM [Microbacterium trichothecenolyticum]|uniref:Phosphocarrier protein HPr n=1 Tax=Microbacterium trichothecenolyticum TaxID=69370 RepID=A0ABU0TT01_MICTR|nr:dihydroxyacetone kinase phosphoryl donor subunit DhaM [Microbacterium trichothecenolyticum]MDQ1122799.1 PTS hybrid protein [Microbacterium trichothecenolyticum]